MFKPTRNFCVRSLRNTFFLCAIATGTWFFPNVAFAMNQVCWFETVNESSGDRSAVRAVERCFDLDTLSGGSTTVGGGIPSIPNPGEAVGGSNASANKDASCNSVGNPIILSTGNKIEPEFDFTSSGEMPLSFTRTYNHYWKGVGLLGKHWVSNLDYSLTFGTTALYGPGGNVNQCFARPGAGTCGVTTNTVIYAWRPDGRTVKYIKNASDGVFYENKADPISKIVVQPNGTFLLYSEDFTYETYTSTGHISKVQNANNISWTFTYANGMYLNRVTHTSGRYLEFTWTNGQMTAVRDPAANYYGYAYNANFFDAGMHRLASSSQPGTPGTTTTYHYEISDVTALTGKSFNGVRHSKFTYGVGGYATSSEHNGLEKTTLAYTPGANGLLTVVETNPLGKQTTHVFQNGKPTTVTGHPSTYCPTTSYALTEYDGNGYPSMRTDFNNNKTAYVYNAKGKLLTRIDAYGTAQARTTNYEWWGSAFQFRLMRETVVGLASTLYNYVSPNRISSITVTNLSPFGVPNQSRVTWYTYSDYGTMSGGVSSPGMLKSITVDGPLAGSDDSHTVNFSNLGNQTSSSNSLGHTTTYSNHNGLGQPGRVIGANGDITDMAYDSRGRVTLRRTYPTTTTLADTTYAYNSDGTAASVTTADGITTSYQYDAGLRVIKQYRDASGVLAGGGTQEQQSFVYNLASDVTSINNWSVEGQPVLKRSAFTDYDELSRPRASRGNNGQNVKYTYDLNGNVKTITDSLNRVTTLTYDALDRVIESKDALNGLTKFEYNAADQLTKVTDPRGKITTYVYDGFGQLWAQTSPDTGTTTFTYNAYGQRTQMTRSDSSVTTYAYDTLGRLTTVTAGGQTQVYGYDWCINGKSRLCEANGPGTIIHYQYELDGRTRVRRELTTANSVQTDYWTRYYYDGIGRLNAITYPNGQAVGYGYANGKLKTMTVNIGGVVTNLVTGTLYQPFGPATSWTYGNGLTRSYAYDLDGRPTAIAAKNGTTTVQSLAYLYNANDQITRITNATNPGTTQDYVYDELSRLKQFSTGFNDTLTYSFDANGNRTQMVRSGQLSQTDTYTVNANNNRLSGISGGQTLSFEYDVKGNTTSGGDNSYTYDGFNRLASVTRAGVTSTYIFNAYGQRVYKAAPSHGYARYIYGGQNQILAEHKDDGDIWTNYLWFGGELIGMVRGTQTYFIHNDHLGRPEIATNTAKTKVWQANNYAFNRSLPLDNIGGLALGFPGQHFDPESGLWYNRFRDYDSNTGRYIQSDPIGLVGGLNTYTYVGGNPVNAVDSLGLETCLLTTVGPGGVRDHSAVFTSRGDAGGPALYDPAGSFGAANGGGSSGLVSGDAASIANFKAHHSGQQVESTCKDTSQKEEENIINNAMDLPSAGPGQCAIMSSTALSGQPSFPYVEAGTWFPGNLLRQFRKGP